MEKKLILGCGALNLDFFYEVDDFAGLPLDLTPGREVWGSREEAQALIGWLPSTSLIHKDGGGSAANTIFALSLLGFATIFLGRVGQDGEGEEVLSLFGEVGRGLIERKGKTALCLSLIGPGRDRALFVSPNPEEGVPEFSPPQGLAHVHLSSFVSAAGLQGQIRLLKELSNQITVSIDPGEIYCRRGLESLLSLLRRANLVFLTSEELRLLSLSPRELLSLGPELVVVKKGAKGAEVWKEDRVVPVPAVPVQSVVDTTGAGDAFDAGFLAAWLKGEDIFRCGLAGARLAAISLTGYGREGLRKAKRLREEVFS
ncbi:hypothetical protein G4V39_01350 [Thermosulfuriphilus ammonigenes]|uniref:Uncharacterized protein n=1 Tax=Thermosulfuriphilus ammonigenes TaxID=1936021 RepID=A0A6G7PTJ1_9BACT|nr:PfkB family carbohydrate kinase [Thermosulfuriphilus ammonigenes]MBA2848882.1 ribokinase [Thermosulfuriphilus ammonigenes]QIJ70999.1 hypothetical protein G4V39_01350 [Thermosulfuriphilus ammonigenes]